MATTWDAFLSEIAQVQVFLDNQKKVVDKKSLAECMAAHVKQITSRSNLITTAEGATKFSDLISTGPWTDDQKVQLGTWASEILLQSSPGGQSKKRESQVVTTFHQYFSKHDVEVLSSAQTVLQLKLQCTLNCIYACFR